jgi:hypothetical protein
VGLFLICPCDITMFYVGRGHMFFIILLSVPGTQYIINIMNIKTLCVIVLRKVKKKENYLWFLQGEVKDNQNLAGVF